MGKATVEIKGKTVTVEGTPEQIESAVKQITGFEAENAPKKSAAENIGGAIKDAGTEVMRGFSQQGADIMGNLDAATKIGEKLTGIPRSGTFGEMSESLRAGAENIPETNLAPLDKQMYQTVGRLPGMAAEFAVLNEATMALKVPMVIKAAFGDIPASGQMTTAVTMGIQSAINEFRQSESFIKATNAAQSGVTATLGLGVAAAAVPKAIEIGKTMGKSAAKAFLKGVTGDEKFAESFVQNPWKFNLNPFQKVSSLKDVEADNLAKIKALDDEYKMKLSDVKVQNAEKRAALSSELDKDYFAMREKNRELQGALSSKGKMDVDKVSKDAKISFDRTVDGVHTGLHDSFSNTLTKIDLLKETYGKKVGAAVENVTNKDPFSRISMHKYLTKYAEVAEKNGYKIQQGQVVPAFGQGTADEATVKLLQQNLDDIKAVVNLSGVPLGFAQKKKELWQKMGYSGESPANNVLKQLSGALNPVNMADDIVGNNIKAEIGALKQANSEFATMLPKYEEAIKNFTRLDATGKPIADFQRVLNAVRNNDKTTLKQIAKADSLLPQEDRLLPKAMDAAKRISNAETIHNANVKLAKRKATEQLSELKVKIREKEFKMRQANKERRFSEAQRLNQQLNNMKNVEMAKLEQTTERLNSEIEFARQQNLARSFTPPSGARRTIQFGAVASMAGGAVANPGLAAMAGLGTLALSPKVAAATVKGTAKNANVAADTLKALSQMVSQRLEKMY